MRAVLPGDSGTLTKEERMLGVYTRKELRHELESVPHRTRGVFIPWLIQHRGEKTFKTLVRQGVLRPPAYRGQLTLAAPSDTEGGLTLTHTEGGLELV